MIAQKQQVVGFALTGLKEREAEAVWLIVMRLEHLQGE